jgi:hypothetical protein
MTISESVASILAVPVEVLPVGAARNDLCELAAPGEDMYCHAPIQLEPQPELRHWNLWLLGVRWDLREWLQQFSHGTDEVY